MKALEISCFPPLEYACSEAINSLCTNLTFCGNDVKRIMLTSCRGDEGKTFLTMNAARTMAGLGKKVVVLDADLRRSNIAAVYNMSSGRGNDFGVTHYLAGKCELNEILYHTNVPGLCIVPVGRTIANPLPLLSSPRFSRLLDDLPEVFDYVLVDAPPVGAVIDAAEIAKSCDGTLFVVRYNEIHRRELAEAKQQISRTGCPILGAVINRIPLNSYCGKRYYYKSYYGGSGNGKTRKKRAKPA